MLARSGLSGALLLLTFHLFDFNFGFLGKSEFLMQTVIVVARSLQTHHRAEILGPDLTISGKRHQSEYEMESITRSSASSDSSRRG